MEETGFEKVFQNLAGKVVGFGKLGCDNGGIPVERRRTPPQIRRCADGVS
jgi:hypothetical protein